MFLTLLPLFGYAVLPPLCRGGTLRPMHGFFSTTCGSRGDSTEMGSAHLPRPTLRSATPSAGRRGIKALIPRRPARHALARHRPTHLATIGLVFAVFAGGCTKPLLSPNEPRSQYSRYDLVRGQFAPQYVEDEFGRKMPNLRGRLLMAE